MKYFVVLICGVLWLVSVFFLVWVVDVLLGMVLVEKQLLVCYIKDEFVLLDFVKVVGLLEIQVICDLFEGLVNQDVKGNLVSGVVICWQSNDNCVWIFILCDNVCWFDGMLVIVEDFVYSWQCLVDLKIILLFVWFVVLVGIVNVQNIIDGKVVLEILGVIVVDVYILWVQLDKLLLWFSNLIVSFVFYLV